MADEATDVNTEETTSESSSDTNETTETTQESTDDSQEAQDDSKDTKFVPYERFSEVNSKYKKLEREVEELKADRTPKTPPNPQEVEVKEKLNTMMKDLGYVSKEDLDRQRADDALKSQVADLKSKYDGKDGRPKFDYIKSLEFAEKNLIGNLDVAYKMMNEAKLTDWAVKQALGKTKGTKSEVSDGSGSANVGTSQEELRSLAAKGDKDAMNTLVKRALS